MTDWTPELIQAKLRPGLQKRKCHNMASLFSNDLIEGRPGNEIGVELMNSGFFAIARANSAKFHNRSQGATADLIELSNVIHDAPAPYAIGEMLVRKYPMMTESKKIRIRDRGKAVKTGRGGFSRGRGGTNTFVKLSPEDILEDHDSWDREYLEDSDWDVAMDEAMAITKGLNELCSKVIIDKLDNIAASKTATGSLYTGVVLGKLALDDIIKMRAQMHNINTVPNALVLSSIEAGDLLQDDDFKDERLYGSYVDKNEGYLGKILGLDVWETTQIASGHILMLDINEVLAMGVRRDKLMESYQETKNGNTKYGIRISTRYDLIEVQPKYLYRCETA